MCAKRVGSVGASSETSAAEQSALIATLDDPTTSPFTPPIKRIDTHGAIVFLVGDDVYKIKRAVHFPFMDFSTLEKRKAACEAELAINKPNAPDLYNDVVAINLTTQPANLSDKPGIQIGGNGPAIEWAVHMRRFDETATLDNLAAAGELSLALVHDLALAVSRTHEFAPRRIDAPSAASLRAYIGESDDTFRSIPQLIRPAHAELLRERSLAALVSLEGLLANRSHNGYVRRCHGDLHLRNVALIDGRPVIFDAIEFNDTIATTDILYDLAFLIMDIERFGLRSHGNHLLNVYLAEADETNLDGLAALPLFLSIRAAIRAKVTALAPSFGASEQLHDEATSYFELASQLIERRPARLVAIGGLSGSGKTTLAAQIAPDIGAAPGAVHLRSDVERKRHFGVRDNERLPEQAYTPAISEQIYSRLRRKAARALLAGHSVVIDAVNDRTADRDALETIALQCNVPFTGIWLDAPIHSMIARVGGRVGDASDADAAIVRAQSMRDIGPMSWSRIDASLDRAEVVDAVLRQLGTGAD